MKKEMTINTHIQTLIFMHDCVILPKFGGFVTSYTSARIDYKLGKIYPPSKNILFNSKLQTNDGTLTSHIAKLHNITYSEASSLIDTEISSIKTELNKGIACYFNGVGTILKNRDGRLIFEPDNTINFSSHTFGLPPTQLIHKTQKHNSTKQHYSATSFLKQGIAATVALGLIFLAGLNPSNDANINQSSMSIINNQMVVNGYDFVKQAMTITEIDDIKSLRDCVVIENVAEPSHEQVEEATTVSKLEQVAVVQSYHIIIGCFSNENNVNHLISELSKSGHKPSVQGINKRGLTRVSIDSYNSNQEAEKAIKELKAEYSGAWILHE